LEFHVSDWVPPLLNAARAFVTVVAVQIFWIWTQWPSGPLAITFAAITVILLSPRAEEAYVMSIKFMIGTAIAALAAAVVLFVGLPNVDRFAGFALVLGLFLVPAGALMAQPWNTALFLPIVANFTPILAPANQMSYNTIEFYNTALAIVAGCAVGSLSFRLIPPLSPQQRSRRLLVLSLRDLRRLATDPDRRNWGWEGRLYSRIAALSNEAEPLDRAILVTALAVGRNFVSLQDSAAQLGFEREFAAALGHFSAGDCRATLMQLDAADRRLAALAGNRPAAMRARAQILAIRDALADRSTYFETGADH
jgi:uncharacterized membrane protein YccC